MVASREAGTVQTKTFGLGIANSGAVPATVGNERAPASKAASRFNGESEGGRRPPAVGGGSRGAPSTGPRRCATDDQALPKAAHRA